MSMDYLLYSSDELHLEILGLLNGVPAYPGTCSPVHLFIY